MDMHVFVINLDTPNGRARWPKVSTQCRAAGLQCERVVGVNGAALPMSTVRKVASPVCTWFCSPAMVGCALSHMRCWRAVVDRGLPMAVILEDDATLVPEFSAKVEHVLRHAPPDWHVIMLGCFLCDPEDQAFTTMEPMFDNGVVRELRNFAGMHAYVVSNAGARYLIREAPRVRYHIDIQMNGVKGLRIYGVHDDLAFQGTETATSTLMSADFPTTMNAVLSHAKDTKGVGLDFYANGVLARIGPYEGTHIFVTPLAIVFLVMGLARVPWPWVLGVSAVDMLLFPPRSLKSPATLLGAYGLGYITRAGCSRRWRD